MARFKIIFSASFGFILFLASCASSISIPQSTPTLPTIIYPTLLSPTPSPSCRPVSAQPTPGLDTPSIFPPITKSDHIRGPENASVTILYYIDYQDYRSGLFEDALDQLLKENPDDIRAVTRIFPLISVNDKAALAAQAVEAAAGQDKFWEMHNLLFEQQANWIDLSVEDFEQWVTAQASTLGLNASQFQMDMKREDIVAKVKQEWEDGQKIGLPGTPLVVINGEIYGGPRDFASMDDIIKLIVLGGKQYACPSVLIDTNKQYLAKLDTEKGDVVIQLFADKAPVTVNSFIFLARNGWYDNITFHRVIPDLFAQTGDPSGTGKGNPGYYVDTEITPSLKFDKPGMVAMVNSGPDTSGSQFFITYAPAPQFDGKYTIFGEVLKGMDVLKSLTPRDVQPGTALPPGDKLLSIEIEEK